MERPKLVWSCACAPGTVPHLSTPRRFPVPMRRRVGTAICPKACGRVRHERRRTRQRILVAAIDWSFWGSFNSRHPRLRLTGRNFRASGKSWVSSAAVTASPKRFAEHIDGTPAGQPLFSEFVMLFRKELNIGFPCHSFRVFRSAKLTWARSERSSAPAAVPNGPAAPCEAVRS